MDRCSLRALVILVCMGSGCSSYTPVHVMLPEERTGSTVVFSNGLPFASVSLDCASLTVAMEPVYIGNSTYFRAYLAYRNLSSHEFLLAPRTAVKLTAVAETRTVGPDAPEPPSKVLSSVTSWKQAIQATQAILGAVEVLAVHPTTVTGPAGTQWQIDDTAQKAGRTADRTAASMTATEINADIISQNLAQTALRRNTVFPGRQVGGFVYFAAPYLSPTISAVARYTLNLDVETQCGTVRLTFTPIEGE